MSKINFKIKNVKLAFVILIVISIILILLYSHFVLSESITKDDFASDMIQISDNNEETVFKIQKITLYSSANAIDNSKDQSLSDVNICQYSDLAIYLDNSQSSSELTEENTIKQLYIDNIFMTSKLDKGTKILNYKNPLNFGKYKDIEEPVNNRIDFKIINTNQENENNDYDEPTFFTDCSNPINLGYLNKDILTNYSVSSDSSTVSFNGKVLKEANISLDDINYTLNFTIHIVNNLNEKFSYNMKLDVNLDDNNGGIYNGYSYKGKTTTGDQYRFFREII